MHKHGSKSQKQNRKGKKVISKKVNSRLTDMITKGRTYISSSIKMDRKFLVAASAGVVMLGLSAGLMLAAVPQEEVVAVQAPKVGPLVASQSIAIRGDKAYEAVLRDQVISASTGGLDFRQVSKLIDLSKRATPHIEVVRVIIDGTTVALVKDIDEARQVLEDYKLKSVPQGVTLEAVGFKQRVQVTSDFASCNELSTLNGFISPQALATMLTTGKEVIATHVIAENDTLGAIAQKYGMTVEALTAANPQIAQQKYLKLGDKLNLAQKQSLVTVQVKGYKTITETKNADVVYEPSNKLYLGEKKLITKGIPAQKQVTLKVVYENGVVVDQQVVKENVVQQMVPERYAQGTKAKPTKVVATANATGTGGQIAGGLLSRPAKGYIVYSRFGVRGSGFHTGIDLSMPSGSPVYAAAPGTVVFSGNQGSYGLFIVVDHGGGLKTCYSHNSKNLVKVGTVVKKGDLIARSGQTGRATGPHLHFEVRKNNVPVNPERYLNFK